MNFDQVCEQSGLQRETVRYYVESKLLAPLFPRRYLPEEGEYADEDVARLQAIANLRRLNFSIDDIRLLLLDPTKSKQLTESHVEELVDTQTITAQRQEYLNQLAPSKFETSDQIIDYYQNLNIDIPLPRRDINQDEGQKVRSDIAERTQQIEELLEQLNKSEHRRKTTNRVLLVLVILFLLTLGWIIAPIWMVYLPKP
ncbi:MAG: MerR family transcriptional regulator [Fastidiosipilaceae bacterium]|jgi:DNA-binding transcriptional MerR regulator